MHCRALFWLHALVAAAFAQTNQSLPLLRFGLLAPLAINTINATSLTAYYVGYVGLEVALMEAGMAAAVNYVNSRTDILSGAV
ncbi:uncharacterized protein BJ171DRAFT_491944, partial [Polychytrium aggregatum]|uniref:uncharacterized protein n=1 Tax=Polychytrium aggregatum TaxID=110093 RepID=UPI0022FE7823